MIAYLVIQFLFLFLNLFSQYTQFIVLRVLELG